MTPPQAQANVTSSSDEDNDEEAIIIAASCLVETDHPVLGDFGLLWYL